MIEQRTAEWFEQRKGRVTASVAGAILGLSPFMTRSDTMRMMVRESLGAPSEFPDPVPPPVAWGNAMEAGAIAEFEMDAGLTTTEAPFIPHEEWLGCSPDRLIYDDYGLEQKCPWGIRKDPEPIFKTLKEQPHYFAQVQVCLYVTKRRMWYFNQWTPHGSKCETVLRDEGWMLDNIPRLKEFYCEYLHELENNSEEHLSEKRVTIDTIEAAKMVAEFEQLSEAIEVATERKKELMAEMADMAKTNAIFAGRKLTLVQKEGSISYGKAIKELLPDASLEKWRGKPSSYWKLS
jgi:putative phage-type endonuclease